MKGVLGSIRKRNADDFMSRVEEGDNDNDGAEQQTTMVELAQRLPTVISFNCTVKRKIGRARRDLTLDLDKLTVTQTGGTARKVLHCHKFVSLVHTTGRAKLCCPGRPPAPRTERSQNAFRPLVYGTFLG